ncbi:3-Deoxy-D-manno-octulosonic-acid transferase [Cyanobium sp. PCC 7001]|uniref:lysophospholipid acyltransferase family protein n=1 Tax=Cyanobium sp. PCC 7001 TaxID=180281 RepID=UPI0001804F23|nr:lysophospholipid acyltransferase family protein [Cyanobium sp. PCC 7001]EDY38222.1 3-Deoxy-D-manno-octulosonic-acid transferase [Cyanobium sp. PCC 7001]
MKKRTLLNHDALAWLAGALLNAYGQLILLTSRIAVQRDPATARLVLEQRVPVIYALWHCHVFFMPMLRLSSRQPVAVLLSAHRDAQIVGVAARMRGVELVAGSSTRGGVRAYLQLIQRLRGGSSVCITPDGPRGPARRVKPGVVHLAQQSGCAVVPMGLAATRQRRLRSWDRTLLPLPFGRVVLTLGPPLWLPPAPDACTLGLQAEQLEAALDAASERAIRAL